MTWKSGRVLLPTVASVLLLAAFLVTAQPATAATASASGKYCLTVVERIKSGAPESRIVSRVCSDRHAPGSVLPEGVAVPETVALLVTFFQNLNYGGYYDTVGGNSGPCDSTGYGMSNLTLVNFNVHGISSYRPNPPCRVASYWTGTNYTGTPRLNYVGDNGYVGAQWNDNLYSMKIRS